MKERGKLDTLGRRIEALSLGHGKIDRPVLRFFRPLLRLRPVTVRSSEIVRFLSACAGSVWNAKERRKFFREAVSELESNISSVERFAITHHTVSVAHAAWLRKIYEILVRGAASIDLPADAVELRLVSRDPFALLPPLKSTATARKGSPPVVRAEVNLRLSAVDNLMRSAQEEVDFYARRRRLLEAARQLLLDCSAEVELNTADVSARKTAIADEISRINQLEAAGIDPNVALIHQARSALARGEHGKLFAATVALEYSAAVQGDRASYDSADRMMSLLWGGDPRTSDAKSASLESSYREVFGERVVAAVNAGYTQLRENAPFYKHQTPDFDKDLLEYMAPGAERASLHLATSVDGCFDVGGTLSPTRVKEFTTEVVTVSEPTQNMVLEPARNVDDLKNAVFSDPRAAIVDFASGKLLARRFLKNESRSRMRTSMQSEARVYVLDGSGSMIGPRARLRDSILVAELATLARRLEQRDSSRIVLFFQYFTRELSPITRVDTPAGAVAAIESILATPRDGGTDIELALLASIEQVRAAQGADPDLSRGQIVLVTDGRAPIDGMKVRDALASLGDLKLGISVIAIGEENDLLRAMVLAQKRQGIRAFYQFIADSELAALSSEVASNAPALFLPGARKDALSAAESRELRDEIAQRLEEIDVRSRVRSAERIQKLAEGEEAMRLWRESETNREIEQEIAAVVGPDAVEVAADRTTIEAQQREKQKQLALEMAAAQSDAHVIERRFRRWFPAPTSVAKRPEPESGTIEKIDIDSVKLLLSCVAEVLDVIESRSSLERKNDAVDLLERMLPDTMMTPARYFATVESYPGQLAEALGCVHEKVGERQPAREAARAVRN